MALISAARRTAFRILATVARGHSHSDDLLREKAVDNLSAADRHLTSMLVLGVIRWQIRLDAQIRALLARPNAKLDTEVLIALRLGAFQLLHLDRIPAHAAIDESVELTRKAGHHFASGMVNAVLRKLAAAPRADFAKASCAELALESSHPAWLVERWIGFYGFEAAAAICDYDQMHSTPSIRIESAAVEAELVECGIELKPGKLLALARMVVSGDVMASAAFQQGRVRFQDEGSQLIAEIAALRDTLPIESILDCCAAPGGKTLILAARNPEARILACELSQERLSQLSKRLAAHADRVECRHVDAVSLEERAVFDVALADVPCSGTGTLGRNPEIRHRLRPEDLSRQAGQQCAILRAALRSVRPGGLVVYSTCSLEPEENESVVSTVLAETPHARRVPLGQCIESLTTNGVVTAGGAEALRGCITPQGALQLRPGSMDTDGFFAALIQVAG